MTTHLFRPAFIAFSLLAACMTTEVTPGEDPPTTAIAVTRPAAGDVLVRGSSQRIEWGAPDGVDLVDLKLLSGGQETSIATGVPNTGSYDWQIPFERSGVIGELELRVVPSEQPAAGGGVSIRIGALAGLRWNGNAEEYHWIHPTTGEILILGAVGDLQLLPWPRPAAVDQAQHRMYVLGSAIDGVQNIYTLDTRTGDVLGQQALATMASTIVAHDGTLLAMRWNDASSKEEITVLDPTTGNEVRHGTVGDLTAWQGQTAIDPVTDRLYVLGLDAALQGTIYAVDLATGAPIHQAAITMGGQPIDNLGGLVGHAAGELHAFRWNEATSTEQVVRVDPTTGVATLIGSVGDLQTWGFTAVSNPTDGAIYVFGTDAAQHDKLYVLDAQSGALRHAVPTSGRPITAMLVY